MDSVHGYIFFTKFCIGVVSQIYASVSNFWWPFQGFWFCGRSDFATSIDLASRAACDEGCVIN